MSNSPVVQSRLSKSALFSLIFGILGCVPFITGILAFFLGIFGFFATGKPGIRGRWMAIVGIILAVVSIGLWSTVGLSVVVGWAGIKSAVAELTAPGHAAHDFIHAVDTGDDAGAKGLSALSDADFEAAKTLIKAQGGFTDSTFNNVNITNDDAQVSGTGDFKTGTRQVSALQTESELLYFRKHYGLIGLFHSVFLMMVTDIYVALKPRRDAIRRQAAVRHARTVLQKLVETRLASQPTV